MSALNGRFEALFADMWGGENVAAITKWTLTDVEAGGILHRRVVGPTAPAQFRRAILGL